jgi:hypothetical protein
VGKKDLGLEKGTRAFLFGVVLKLKYLRFPVYK